MDIGIQTDVELPPSGDQIRSDKTNEIPQQPLPHSYSYSDLWSSLDTWLSDSGPILSQSQVNSPGIDLSGVDLSQFYLLTNQQTSLGSNIPVPGYQPNQDLNQYLFGTPSNRDENNAMLDCTMGSDDLTFYQSMDLDFSLLVPPTEGDLLQRHSESSYDTSKQDS